MLKGRLNKKFMSLLGLNFQIASPKLKQAAHPKLEQVASSHINILNVLYRLPPWLVRIGQQNYQVNAEWPSDHTEILDAWRIVIQAQDSRIELVVEHSILQHVIAELDPSLILSDLSESLLALLLELALEQTLEHLEETFQTSLAIIAVVKETPLAALDAPVIVTLRIKNDTKFSFPCLLRLASADLARFRSYTDDYDFPERKSHCPDVPIPVYARWGVVELPILELQNLSPGDIILPDDVCDNSDTVMLVIADQLIAKASDTEPATYCSTS